MARTEQEVRKELRELRREMKANGIRKACTMNRLERHEFQANMLRERLELELSYILRQVPVRNW